MNFLEKMFGTKTVVTPSIADEPTVEFACMPVVQKIYTILNKAPMTNKDLAQLIYGRVDASTTGNIRFRISQVRSQYKVNIIPNAYGKYMLTRPFTAEEQEFRNALPAQAKNGAPHLWQLRYKVA